MIKKGGDTKMDKDIKKYIQRPLIIAIGVYVVGSFISEAFGIAGAAIALFFAVGGYRFFAKLFTEK